MKTLTGVIALMLALLFGASNVVVAAEKAATPAAPAARTHLYPKITMKVTGVDPNAKTFTGISKGKPFTFGSKSLKVIPKVGAIIDITYTQNPGGPMEATTVNGSKSNSY